MRKFSFLILHVSLVAAIAGCATWRAQPPLRAATAEQLMELLQERQAAIRTMKGLFRAKIKGPGLPIAQRVEGAMYYRRPGSLRIQGFNHLGGELFELVLGNDAYRLRLPSLGKLFAGRMEEWERMGQIGRPFKLSFLTVSGAVGVASVSVGDGVNLVEDGDRYRLDVLTPMEAGQGKKFQLSRRLWFERRSLQVVQVDLMTEGGDVEVTIEFEDFREVVLPSIDQRTQTDLGAFSAPIMKPFRITTYDRRDQGSLVLTFHEIMVNTSLQPSELGVAGERGVSAG